MVTNGATRWDTWPERTSLASVAVARLAFAGWFAATWVDPSGTDLTCGGLYRTDLWLGGLDICTRVMVRRLSAVVALVAIAAGLGYLAARRPRRPRSGPDMASWQRNAAARALGGPTLVRRVGGGFR